MSHEEYDNEDILHDALHSIAASSRSIRLRTGCSVHHHDHECSDPVYGSGRRLYSPETSTQTFESKETAEPRFLPLETFPAGTVRCSSQSTEHVNDIRKP